MISVDVGTLSLLELKAELLPYLPDGHSFTTYTDGATRYWVIHQIEEASGEAVWSSAGHPDERLAVLELYGHLVMASKPPVLNPNWDTSRRRFDGPQVLSLVDLRGLYPEVPSDLDPTEIENAYTRK